MCIQALALFPTHEEILTSQFVTFSGDSTAMSSTTMLWSLVLGSCMARLLTYPQSILSRTLSNYLTLGIDFRGNHRYIGD
jgi:hypothetical protein